MDADDASQNIEVIHPAKAAGESAEVTSDPEGATSPMSVTHRVVKLLDLVGRMDGGVGAREAERITGIDRSAVSRIFRQLEGFGWVEQVDNRGTYRVGPAMFAVAAAVRQRDSLWQAAAPLLQALTDRFDETTYLAVRRGDQVVFVEKVDCSQPIRYFVELNQPFPLTTGAAGRSILTAIPRQEAAAVVASGLVAYTPASITEPEKYLDQLDEDRDLGYVYSQSGWVTRGAGVAAAFFEASGGCAGAITLSAPLDRLTPDAVLTIGPAVRAVAHQLSHRLGYTGEHPDELAE